MSLGTMPKNILGLFCTNGHVCVALMKYNILMCIGTYLPLN